MFILAGCGDDELTRLRDPAILVVAADGTTHEHGISLEFVDSGVSVLEVRSVGGSRLIMTEVCFVRAGEADQTRPCLPEGRTPFEHDSIGEPIAVGSARQMELRHFSDRSGLRRVELRIQSNAVNAPVIFVPILAASPESPTVHIPEVHIPETGQIDPPGAIIEACELETEIHPSEVVRPADVIWVIDGSGSMDQERRTIRQNLNRFAASISGAGIDHRVIVIGQASEIDVPPPLGGSSSLLIVDRDVDSNAGLEVILDAYPQYQDFLRADSIKHIIAVTDDESRIDAVTFRARLSGLSSPGFGPVWVLHSIVAFGRIPVVGCVGITGTGSAIGQQYLDLSATTGGVVFSICERDWTPVFDTIANAIYRESALPCVFALPTPPPGAVLDPSRVDVSWQSAVSGSESIPRVPEPGACNGPGWYLDATSVVVCEATCQELRATSDGSVRLHVGCTR